MVTFGLLLAAAVVLALLLMLLTEKRNGLETGTILLFAGLAIPLCILMGRAAFWLCSLDWIKNSELSFWDFLGTGYSYMLYGALAGGIVAAFLTARIRRVPAGKIADAAAAPAALLIAVGRFAEYTIDAGFGTSILTWFDPEESWSMISWEDPEFICRFPFAVQNYYGTWRFAINLWEGLAAILFVVVLLRLKNCRNGGKATLLLGMYAACQIVFESMRKDEVIIWGFVMANQLISMILLLGLLVLCWVKLPKAQRSGKELAGRLGLMLLGAGVIMLMEFALDQKINFLLWMRADLTYLIMAASCAWVLYQVVTVWKKAFIRLET